MPHSEAFEKCVSYSEDPDAANRGNAVQGSALTGIVYKRIIHFHPWLAGHLSYSGSLSKGLIDFTPFLELQ